MPSAFESYCELTCNWIWDQLLW